LENKSVVNLELSIAAVGSMMAKFDRDKSIQIHYARKANDGNRKRNSGIGQLNSVLRRNIKLNN
jgi:hypothetical protein